jgi:myo-inositol-1(or 4)-monophosphatase
MPNAPSALEADWLGASRRATEALAAVLAGRPTTEERAEETGDRGEGGDRTLVIDAKAEVAIFEQLDEIHAQGYRFCALSEERGVVDYGTDDVRVIIDPIDGSLNAKRGVPSHAVSIAVADGPTMADVAFGFVHDFGTGEEWRAARGEGAFVSDERIDPSRRERRNQAGRLEVVGIESADPRWVAQSIEALLEVTHRLRAVGSIALTLCQVGAARFDAMASLKRCRAVDAAAAQLIAREGGALVAFPDPEAGDLDAPLDAVPRVPVIAARSAEALDEMRRVPSV